MRTSLTLLLALFICTCASAQGFSGGFRAGLNFITQSGPVEMSADGMTNYEEASRTTGFHVGATFAYEFTDLVGVKADLMYSQRGGEFDYTDAPAYFFLYTDVDDTEGQVFFGNLDGELSVVNSYIDIPVTAYYKLGKLEIEGGVSAGLLINSRVSGGLTYKDVPPFNRDFVFNVDGNFLSDEAGLEGLVSASDAPNAVLNEPATIGAYYNNNSDENRYNRLEFGLVGGLAYYLNNGLYIGGRYQYGLTDITGDENDQRITVDPDNPGLAFNNDDKDFTRTFQLSIGFRF